MNYTQAQIDRANAVSLEDFLRTQGETLIKLVMDMGTVLDGRQAVEEGLIDELGGLRDALGYLYKEIEK